MIDTSKIRDVLVNYPRLACGSHRFGEKESLDEYTRDMQGWTMIVI
jgi:hypothetical protein